MVLTVIMVLTGFVGVVNSRIALCLQAGSLGAQLQAHSLQGPAPLTLQLPISRRVPLEGAELVAYQEQKRKEEMGALQRPAPQPSDAALVEPTPTRLAEPIPTST